MSTYSVALRQLKEKDAVGMEEWMNDDEITQYFRFHRQKKSRREILDFIASSCTEQNQHFAIVNKNDEYLGTVSLKNINMIPRTAEYAIVLRKSVHGLGVAEQATRLVLERAFTDLHLKVVYLNVLTSNATAIHFYEKMGFGRDYELYRSFQEKDQDLDLYYYSITRESYILKKCRIIDFSEKGDERGKLVIAECRENIPFNINRVFYMYDTERGICRGEHANRRSEFVMIALKGQVTVETDNGREKERYLLDRPTRGLYIPRMIWKRMSGFSDDSLLLVLSNEKYDAGEYIRDYDSFLKEMAEIY